MNPQGVFEISHFSHAQMLSFILVLSHFCLNLTDIILFKSNVVKTHFRNYGNKAFVRTIRKYPTFERINLADKQAHIKRLY